MIALVAGANRGLGRETARQLLAADLAVVREAAETNVFGPWQLVGRPVSEGTAGIVWAATLPDGGPTGGFFRDGKAIAW